jgi:hypothetical protein
MEAAEIPNLPESQDGDRLIANSRYRRRMRALCMQSWMRFVWLAG